MSGAERLGILKDCECEVSGGGEWGDGKYWVRRKEWLTMTRWGTERSKQKLWYALSREWSRGHPLACSLRRYFREKNCIYVVSVLCR
jgi:hypothetical protein